MNDQPSVRHLPVLSAEVMSALDPQPGGVLLDATVGLGGHAQVWLERTTPGGRVLGFDRDRSALEAAGERLRSYGERFRPIHADYRELDSQLDSLGVALVDAALFDLGLGSHQLDQPERGFSFRFDGPLDMRFDRSRPATTAAELLAQSSEQELARIFFEFGEERQSRKIARAICEARRRTPITTAAQLADLIRRAVPASRHERIDPATRTFQALRIAVNHELDQLDEAIEAAVRRLLPGGRIAIISFHSLEDRIAKSTLRRLAEPCRCRRGDPCSCNAVMLLRLEQRRSTPCSDQEAASNPRARSARLRWGIRQ
jgi:16S rRNA (cytosine1402-N4)-methyltransferase